VTSTVPDVIASVPAGGVASPLRWRFTLQSMWERKLDEVIALSGACAGTSVAGGDLPADDTTLPPLRLYRRAARAYEDLAALADAIARADAGTYGVCAGCGRPMADEWLAHDPVVRRCPGCSLPPPRGAAGGAQVVSVTTGICHSNCSTTWPA
jgi:hypothetical protein